MKLPFLAALCAADVPAARAPDSSTPARKPVKRLFTPDKHTIKVVMATAGHAVLAEPEPVSLTVLVGHWGTSWM